MGLPKRRHSKTRRDKRRTHYVLDGPSLCLCPKCGKPKPPHYVCPLCGYYKGVDILNLEEKKKKEEKKRKRKQKT